MPIATALLMVSLWSATPASSKEHPKPSLVQTIKAARRECARPGPRLAELVERSFDASSFGKEVVPGWNELSREQRDAFVALADEVIGKEQRQGYASEFCEHGQHIVWMEKLGVDAITRVKTRFFVRGETGSAELWFRDDGDRWTYVGEWFGGVDVFILTWRERFKGGYDAAMAKLREGG